MRRVSIACEAYILASQGDYAVLRILFGEPPREWKGQSLETVKAIEHFIGLVYDTALQTKDENIQHQYKTYGVWAEGLLRSMDELEQSCYAAKQYARLVLHTRLEAFTPEEQLNYHRHVYFDKNAYIRLFALLDKLGTLLNELLELKTERLKSHFSYFTVLRNMRLNKLHIELMEPLYQLKEQYREAFSHMRGRRNTEIHQMNAELQDDLRSMLARPGVERKLEDLGSNMADLDHGWALACQTLGHSFRYASKLVMQRS
jgi:hypothetical protein